VLSSAVSSAVLRDFARMADTELVLIDADTTTDAFADRLRWNQAYHRLAHGLR
jgi:L-arabinose isomerase